MRLLFKQRMFTWFDSYDIYDDAGHTIYTVEGKLSWGHRLVIYNAMREEIGEIREEVFTFLPRFRMYMNGSCIGFIEREFTFFKPKYHLSCNDWKIEGNFMAWDYDVISEQDGCIMHASKEICHLTDTYVLDIRQDGHALLSLMIVLAIDAAKCSGNG